MGFAGSRAMPKPFVPQCVSGSSSSLTPPRGGRRERPADNLGNLLTINYHHSGTVTYAYDGLNRLTNMVDSVGTTKFYWTAGDQLAAEDGPWANDTVTNTYNNRFR